MSVYSAVVLQISLTGLCALIAALVVGWPGAVSALWAGVAVFLPGLLMALQPRLVDSYCSALRTRGTEVPLQTQVSMGSAMLLVGAFVKLVLSIAIMVAAAFWYQELVWSVFLFTLFVVLHAGWGALLIKPEFDRWFGYKPLS